MFDEEAKDSRSASLHAAGSLSTGAGSGFGESYSLSNPSIRADEDIPQPTIFNGKLKGYQLKGMNWLANLYEQVHVSYFIFFYCFFWLMLRFSETLSIPLVCFHYYELGSF